MDILLSVKYRDLVMSSTVSVAGLLGLLYTESGLASTNQAPVALAQTVTTKEDTKKSITLRGTDPERKKLTYVIVSQPKHGTVTLSNNKVTYIPNTDYFGQDTFSFKVNDGELNSPPASVSLAITPVNDKPVAENGTANALRNAPQEITLKATDVDGDPLTYLPAKKSKKGGIVTLKTGNTVIYTPKKDYVGTDSFTFAAQDNQKGKSTTATVNVTVEAAPNRPPVVNAGTDQQVDTGKTVTLNGSGSDPDNDTLSYSWKQTAGVPTVVLTKSNSATASFTAPSVTANTKLTFALTVTDGRGGVVTDTVDVTVKPANRPPVANAGVDQQALSASLVKLQGSGSDPDNDPLTYGWTQTSGTPVVSLTSANSATASFTAPAISSDTTLTFTLTVNDGRGGKATDNVSVTIKSGTIVEPTPTGRLNDTGMILCTDYDEESTPQHNSSNYNLNCDLAFDNDGDVIPKGQDGHHGRDVTMSDGSDGYAGFSFTKIGSLGEQLPDDATRWSCVKDNVTGLIWSVDQYKYYQSFHWYEPDMTKNGGHAGYRGEGSDICNMYIESNPETYCNTYNYARIFNKYNVCGGSGWRLPTRAELRSLAVYDGRDQAIDDKYFPDLPSFARYWTSTTESGSGFYAVDRPWSNADMAWTVSFDDQISELSAGKGRYGGSYPSKGSQLFVRLVRDGK